MYSYLPNPWSFSLSHCSHCSHCTITPVLEYWTDRTTSLLECRDPVVTLLIKFRNVLRNIDIDYIIMSTLSDPRNVGIMKNRPRGGLQFALIADIPSQMYSLRALCNLMAPRRSNRWR